MLLRQTSLEAYTSINNDGTAKNQREKILSILKRFSDGLTREEIRDYSSIMYSSVCGRCRELIKAGLIYENGEKINRSGKRAKILKIFRGV